jgi:tetraacyldisaccharide 4'-kinase
MFYNNMNFVKYLLIPFQIVYSLIVRVRNLVYDFNIISIYSPHTLVISVGNLKVGGTGKTPMVEYLIKILKNYKIAVLSRGYKRKTKGFVLAKEKRHNAYHIGDENAQLYNKFQEITIGCDENRVNGIKKLLQIDKKIQIIILDDGYQHRALKRDVNILLTEYNQLFINDSLLPIGKLREPKFEKRRANIIIVTKCPHNISKSQQQFIKEILDLDINQKIYFSHIKKHVFLNMNTIKEHKINKDQKHLLVTGIENPLELLNFLNNEKIDFKHLKFNDHHDFSQLDISDIIQLSESENYSKELLLTEKDFYRLSKKDKQKLEKHFTLICIQIEIDFIDADKSTFNHQLCNFVKSKIT